MRRAAWLVLATLLSVGCDSDDGTDAGSTVDAGAIDGGVAPDASPPDAATPDGGAIDGAVTSDAGPPDAGMPPPMGPWTVYVSVGSESRLAVVDLALDGIATEREEASLDLPGRPGPLARDPASGRLYVGLGGGSGTGIGTIEIDGAGVPSLSGTTDGPNPVYIVAAPEQRIVSAYFGDDQVLSHDVSGAPAHAVLDTLMSADEPHAAAMGPNGLIYVPHRNGGTTWWLRLGADGSLERVGELASEDGAGPRHIAFHPSGDFAYIVNEYSDSVSTHTIAADGTLTRIETVSALEGGPSDGNTAADVHVTADGRFLYSTNRGDNSFARFSIAADGRLTFLGNSITEPQPREFELTPGGPYVISLGQASGQMAVYRIQDDGSLMQTARLDIGRQLMWAIAVPTP